MSTGNDPSPNHTVPLDSDGAATAPTPRPRKHRVYLLVAHRDEVVTVPLVEGAGVVIGREPPADVAIPDRSLSRRHARFTLVASDEIEVEDLRSTNGTCIGNRRIERAKVRPGEEVLLGTVAASVHSVTSDDGRPPGAAGHEAFRAAVDAELGRARYLGRPLAVIMIRSLDPKAERGVAWLPRVKRLVRPIDPVALYGAGVVEVMLVETDREQALTIARSIAQPDADGGPLGCGVAFFPGSASAEELIEASLEAGRRATAAQPVQSAASEGHRTLTAGREGGGDGPVMESPAMREVEKLAAHLATAVIPVLIHGETGTGKEVLARLIHAGGPRRARPLIAVNCGAIPPELLESILFGHEKGSFTGAGQQQKGLFEAADGGTILLDEIGELPAAAQAALLRVLEEKRIRRVGSIQETAVDVRVLAATHRDLEAMVASSQFREDLYYRLNVMELALPPLRERRQDIGPLAMRFVQAAAKANNRAVRAISPDAISLLERHPWPGNVRELRNAIDRAVVVAEGDTVTPLDLPPRVRSGTGTLSAAPSSPPPTQAPRYTGPLKSRIEQFERDTIIEALRASNDNQTEAARRLDVPLRTLQHKISTMGIRRRVEHGPGDGGR